LAQEILIHSRYGICSSFFLRPRRRIIMAKQPAKSRKKTPKVTWQDEVPPGATAKAFDRPLGGDGGPPGSGAGPRHAADDVDSENETFGRSDTTRTPASPPQDEEDALEKGPPYAGSSGGAVGGSPAQLRSSEHKAAAQEPAEPADDVPPASSRIPATLPDDDKLRLTGDAAIEYAEKQGLKLNKHTDATIGPRVGLSVAEAQAIAAEEPDLIWLDVSKKDYYSGPPTNYEPG
jgi:hypothetical protein